jgi:hypothetical protein
MIAAYVGQSAFDQIALKARNQARLISVSLADFSVSQEATMNGVRRKTRHALTLAERLSEEAKLLWDEAKTLPPGPRREELLKKARETETTRHLSEWLTSPGLQPPR